MYINIYKDYTCLLLFATFLVSYHQVIYYNVICPLAISFRYFILISMKIILGNGSRACGRNFKLSFEKL